MKNKNERISVGISTRYQKRLLPILLGLILLHPTGMSGPAYAAEPPTPTPSLSVTFTSLADLREVQVNGNFGVYLAIRNIRSADIDNLRVDLIVPPGLNDTTGSISWPSPLKPGESVTRKYILKAITEGKYNIGAIVYYEGEAAEGYTFSVSNIDVKNAPLLGAGLPESAINSIIGFTGVLLGTILGFVLSSTRDFMKERSTREEKLIGSYAKISAWLNETRDWLQQAKFPGSVIAQWNKWPVDDEKSYRILKDSDPAVLREVGTLFEEISTASEGDYQDLALRAGNLRARIDARFRKV